MSNLEIARKLSKQYGFVLPKKYAGYKTVWHPWHQPASRLLYPMTFAQYIDRIIEIGTRKPEIERAERFQLMKISLIQPKGKADEARRKAHEAWRKADEARRKAYAAWQKAYEAWQKADEAMQKAYGAKIKAAHERECPSCKWDGNKLPQFD